MLVYAAISIGGDKGVKVSQKSIDRTRKSDINMHFAPLELRTAAKLVALPDCLVIVSKVTGVQLRPKSSDFLPAKPVEMSVIAN